MNWLPYLNFSIAIIGISITIGTTVFFLGKWAGAQDFIGKELKRIENEVANLKLQIEGLRKETKDDRHMFRGDLQKWQEGLLRDINNRFDSAKTDSVSLQEKLEREINRRFDALDCIRGKKS